MDQARLAQTAQIVSAHVSNNRVSQDEIPKLIREVYGTLTKLGDPVAEPAQSLVPAVPIRQSVKHDYIVCLEDGRPMKMLKRHLATSYNMTPDEYRLKWGLPADYPMVAPAYAQTRSDLAKEIGLGRKRTSPELVRPQRSAAPIVHQIPEGKRGRPRKHPISNVA